MKKFAKITNETTKECGEVGLGTDTEFYKSIGMTEMEIEQAYDGSWYVKGYAPEKTVEMLQGEVREVRNSYLEKYVDPKQFVLVWDGLSEYEKQLYAKYRTYLLDYTKLEGWYLRNPMNFEEWKQSAKPVEEI